MNPPHAGDEHALPAGAGPSVRERAPLLHVVQHTSAEYLGLIEDHLEGRGIRFRYYRPFTGKVALLAPAFVTHGLILLGGGPWGSAGVRDVPTLAAEVALARGCLARNVPMVGIGLGAQILALAAGGGVDAAPLEFAVTTATRSDDAALNGYLPPSYPLAVYMRDWPRPPDDAAILARDPRGRPALFRVGEHGFGFAGHPGLKVAMVEDLIMEFEESPSGIDAPLAALREAQRALEDALVPIMTGLVQLAGWMDARAPAQNALAPSTRAG
jgi:GMP synthase-like glutamine amidotransferase